MDGAGGLMEKICCNTPRHPRQKSKIILKWKENNRCKDVEKIVVGARGYCAPEFLFLGYKTQRNDGAGDCRSNVGAHDNRDRCL